MNFIITKVGEYELQVAYEVGLVRINSDENLYSLLDNEKSGASTIAAVVKNKYQAILGKELDIETNSLAIEILGHVYPNKIIDATRSVPMPEKAKEFINMLHDKASVIDCGERGKDENRMIWDTIDAASRSFISI
ncbi:hypothetical protein ABES80_08685 [Bacillus gobiensis]|uniref:hypothetical protein n=1 Tax=Bacillus gobiensis TaxID=1441095 RepID=UPI003D247E24